MTSLKTSIKTITYLSDIGCLEIQGASLVWFYLCPEHIISDIVNDWQDADTLEKILLVKLYLKTVLILTVVSVIVLSLSSDKFMSVKRRK